MARTALVAFFLSALLGGACAGRGHGRATCPGEGWCGPAADAERMAEAAAGSTRTCPIHVEAAYAQQDGGALPAGVPAGAHGTLDKRRTHKVRADGGAVTCCYAWVDPCPTG